MGIIHTSTLAQAANPSKGLVDPERVYFTGFSMGCMMANRFALERSSITAGFGCHGGTCMTHDHMTIYGHNA